MQGQVQGEDLDMVKDERDNLRTEVPHLQVKLQVQRARVNSAHEALVSLQARADVGEFMDMEIHVDTKELEELERLQGEVATLHAE